ncbi:FAD/NAD(P)-binding protein [Terrihabitans sp. B22-R8]|uniref:FAD/NAD(P)-binding protein n=1 Tax=Terrihabitans sp. B22-R8 TaxID=3425128 RepID=UPI00403C5BD8
MPSTAERRIVIVGGGFAGAVTAINILRRIPGPLSLIVVDPAERLGRGIAYSTPDPDHLVNGVAGLFSLYPDDPDHLVRWLETHAEAGGWSPPLGVPLAKSTPPRDLFGRYVEHELAEARKQASPDIRFTHVHDRVVDVCIDGTGAAHLVLASGGRLTAEQIVLATGLFRRIPPFVPAELAAHPAYIGDVYAPGAFRDIEGARSVLFLGTSLTMLDALISLEKQGFKGSYVAASRRGLVIQPRREVTPWTDIFAARPLPRTLRQILRFVQKERRAIRAAGEDWQRLAPMVRQHFLALWTGLSNHDRVRFTRRLRIFWDVALHRAAPLSYAFLERARAQGRFSHRAANILAFKIDGEGVEVTLRPRGSRHTDRLRVDRVVNCTGDEFDWTRIDDPLIRNLLARDLVRPHPTGFGVDADFATQALIGAEGEPSTTLYAVGHPLRGVSWESSSIREQVDSAIITASALAAGSVQQPRAVA